MERMDIIYYTRKDDKGITISLRELCLREEVALEAIFYALRDSTDEYDLLDNLRRLICDEINLGEVTDTYIQYTITDSDGNTNYLKFKKSRRYENGN